METWQRLVANKRIVMGQYIKSTASNEQFPAPLGSGHTLNLLLQLIKIMSLQDRLAVHDGAHLHRRRYLGEQLDRRQGPQPVQPLRRREIRQTKGRYDGAVASFGSFGRHGPQQQRTAAERNGALEQRLGRIELVNGRDCVGGSMSVDVISTADHFQTRK